MKFTFGSRGCRFARALFVVLLSEAVLSWHPLICHIVLLVHPRRRRIVVVASSLRGSSGLQGLPLGFLLCCILVRVG